MTDASHIPTAEDIPGKVRTIVCGVVRMLAAAGEFAALERLPGG